MLIIFCFLCVPKEILKRNCFQAMRSGRLITKMAVENEVELEPCPGIIPSLPECQHARLCKTSLDQVEMRE